MNFCPINKGLNCSNRCPLFIGDTCGLSFIAELARIFVDREKELETNNLVNALELVEKFGFNVDRQHVDNSKNPESIKLMLI